MNSLGKFCGPTWHILRFMEQNRENSQNCHVRGSVRPLLCMNVICIRIVFVHGVVLKLILFLLLFSLSRTFLKDLEMFHNRFTLLLSPSTVHHFHFTSTTVIRDYMQDAASPQTACKVTALLWAHFGDDHVVSRGFRITLPPVSLDVNPCDFWLWGFLKDHDDRRNIKTVPELH